MRIRDYKEQQKLERKPVNYILISIVIGLGITALVGIYFSLDNPVAKVINMEAPRQMYPPPSANCTDVDEFMASKDPQRYMLGGKR